MPQMLAGRMVYGRPLRERFVEAYNSKGLYRAAPSPLGDVVPHKIGLTFFISVASPGNMTSLLP